MREMQLKFLPLPTCWIYYYILYISLVICYILGVFICTVISCFKHIKIKHKNFKNCSGDEVVYITI